MAITLFGATSNPADNGSADGNPTLTITPVASMVAGQLCIVFSVDRAGTSSHSVSNAAGQSWKKLSNGWGELHWCVFNGTWTTNPVFDYTGTVNLTLIMIVFAPTGPGYLFEFEGEAIADVAAPSSPFTITITGRITTHASTVTIAGWFTSDDNTFGSLSGSGWVKTSLSAQYRNLAGQDSSSSYAYNIQTSTATLANVSQNMSGSDGAATRIATFWEMSPGEFLPRNIEQPYRSKRLVSGTGFRNWGLIPFDTDAQAYIDATGLSSDLHKNLINQLVGALKSASLWTKFHAIYPFIGGTAGLHKWNLKNPVDSDGAFRLTFTGGTHSATGWLPNGTSNYAHTYIVPSSVLSLNDTHLSFYSRTNVAEDKLDIGSNSGTAQLFLGLRDSGNFITYAVNAVNAATALSNSTGLGLISRVNGTEQKAYRNGTLLHTSADASTSLNSHYIVIGARNDNGSISNFSSKECAFATIGSGLTAAEASSLYVIIQAFQTALGRQV